MRPRIEFLRATYIRNPPSRCWYGRIAIPCRCIRVCAEELRTSTRTLSFSMRNRWRNSSPNRWRRGVSRPRFVDIRGRRPPSFASRHLRCDCPLRCATDTRDWHSYRHGSFATTRHPLDASKRAVAGNLRNGRRLVGRLRNFKILRCYAVRCRRARSFNLDSCLRLYAGCGLHRQLPACTPRVPRLTLPSLCGQSSRRSSLGPIHASRSNKFACVAQKPDSLRYELSRSQGPREANSGHLALWFNFRMAIRRLTVFPCPGQSPSGPSSAHHS